MIVRAYFWCFFVFLLFLCISSEANSQVTKKQSPAIRINNEQAAIAKLRELYFRRDFEGGDELGQKLVKQFPENIELNAWFLLNMARNEKGKEAVEAAKKLVEDNKENAWAWFALAHAYIRNAQTKEAVPVAEKALKLMPDNEEFLFLDASSLMAQKKYDEIYVLLDKHSSKIKDQSRRLYMKAEAEYREFSGGDEIKRKPSFETFAKARELSSNSVNANYIYGLYLNSDKRFAEAYPILKRAVALSPNVVHIRQQFWQAILKGQPNKTAEQRNTEVAADLNDLLRLRPDSINALEAVASFYGQELEMPDKKKEIDRIILDKFPQTAQAELILTGEIRAFNYIGADKKIDEKKKAQLTRMLEDFINRSQHFDENQLLIANTRYFYQVKEDKNTTNAELLRVAENISNHQKSNAGSIYSMIVLGLTERQLFREGEKFAVIGFEKIKEESERRRTGGEDKKKIQDDFNTMNATLYNARGWLYFKENRFEEAEVEIFQAIKLNDQFSYFYSNLAKIYEAKKELDKAEDAYINAYSTFYGKNNPNLDKLKSLYQIRNGNLTNFETYFEKIKIIERDRRKTRILSAKIVDAENVTPFNLKNLEAKPISFADLKGKVIVVNIWGTWCVPCVAEMPEFQELHRKYRDDKDVVILTINNDASLETVKKFMTDKKYDFAVLRDDKYLDAVGISTFPTTWFIDREGKISYAKIGSSDKLLEEFDWRIEKLKR